MLPGAFLPAVPAIKVVDVGAMWIGEGVAPYSALLDAGLAAVVGFEPVAEECDKLNRRFGPPHRYLPYAIGDGTRRLFVILHVAYGAIDLCARVLERLDAKTGRASADCYCRQALAGVPGNA